MFPKWKSTRTRRIPDDSLYGTVGQGKKKNLRVERRSEDKLEGCTSFVES